MAGLRPGTLRGEDHWSRYDHTHAAPTGLTTANIVTGDPVAIDPDDAMAAGVATSLARSDHQHAFTSGTAAALTKTATAGEGAAATHARSDHVHATSALPWGVVGYQRLETDNTGAATTDRTTDFALANLSVTNTRLYAVCCAGAVTFSGGSRWIFNFHNTSSGAYIDKLYDIQVGSAAIEFYIARTLWLPATGTISIDVRLDFISGAGTITLNAGAPAGTGRSFWVEDIGPR
jgi:hypothetical protein